MYSDPIELEDHVPVYIPEPEHPEDLVPAEDEAPTPLLPPSFLSPCIRPISPRASLLRLERDLSATCWLARQPGHHYAHRVDAVLSRHYGYQLDVRSKRVQSFTSRHHEPNRIVQAVKAEIEVLRREVAYEQESMETRQALARAADDLAVQHIMRTQALEAGARIDTLEDTGSSS
ncbi:hypothetical protein Tco_1110180 [Tanacetum coccineum]|uniref:Uncharacterized protein n=1 Tax=Tanacetum coccineum TaxID=301880 RepID=A0ABQ5II21_9ASTR